MYGGEEFDQEKFMEIISMDIYESLYEDDY